MRWVPQLKNTAFVVTGSFAVPALTNVATDKLPKALDPYIKYAWPATIALTIVLVVLDYQSKGQATADRNSPSGETAGPTVSVRPGGHVPWAPPSRYPTPGPTRAPRPGANAPCKPTRRSNIVAVILCLLVGLLYGGALVGLFMVQDFYEQREKDKGRSEQQDKLTALNECLTGSWDTLSSTSDAGQQHSYVQLTYKSGGKNRWTFNADGTAVRRGPQVTEGPILGGFYRGKLLTLRSEGTVTYRYTTALGSGALPSTLTLRPIRNSATVETIIGGVPQNDRKPDNVPPSVVFTVTCEGDGLYLTAPGIAANLGRR